MIKPMLAVDYKSKCPPPKERMFPCYIMPKLDGIRAIWYKGEWQTRRGKRWPPGTLAHIQPVDYGYAYDGELYCHGMSLQQINAAIGVNNLEANEDTVRVGFHIFDLICPMWTARERRDKLRELTFGPGCHDVKHQTVHCYDTMNAIHAENLAEGYEGSMLKPFRGQYFSGRTGWLMKYKPFDTDWFEVAGAFEGIGKFKGMLGAFVLRDGQITFSATGGDDKEKKNWLRNVPKYALVKYYGRSDAGIPLKPSVLAVGDVVEAPL